MKKHFAIVIVTIITLLALTGVCSAQSCTPSAGPLVRSDNNIRLSFDKSLSGFGTWEGTIGGDIAGKLKTVMQSYVVNGDIARVEFDFIVDAGSSSFTMRLIGLLNPRTGKVYMDGFVSEGLNQGLRVEEEGSLVDPATFRFIGTILLKRPCR
ncbi:MAG: hypothetical protein ABI977_09115 [Acidobacteriota bacterium]